MTDPAAFKIIYGRGSKYIKSGFYYAFGYPDITNLDMISERDIASHSLKHRKVASLCSLPALLLLYEDFVYRCNHELCSTLEEFVRTLRDH
jgi:hypothetical protein